MGISLRQWVDTQAGPNGEVIAAFAAAVGVTPAAVRHWISGKRKVPPKRWAEIEEATGEQVTRFDLRPDVLGEPPVTETVAVPTPVRIDTPEAVERVLGVSRAVETPAPSVVPDAVEPEVSGDTRVVPFEAPP